MVTRHVIARLYIVQGYILYYVGIVYTYPNHTAFVGARLDGNSDDHFYF